MFGVDDAMAGQKRSVSLALWVSGPVLALAAIVLLFVAVPPVDCGVSGWSAGSSPQRTVLIVFSSIVSLGAAIAGIRQLLALRHRRQWRCQRPWKALALATAGLTALALLKPVYLFDLFIAVSVGVMLLTGMALLGLAIAWARGRDVEGVGAILPLYLLGAGLFCLPSAAIFAVGVANGVLC
jgi:hypothetical protein